MAKNSKNKVSSKFLLYKLEETPRRLEETNLREKGQKEKYIHKSF